MRLIELLYPKSRRRHATLANVTTASLVPKPCPPRLCKRDPATTAHFFDCIIIVSISITPLGQPFHRARARNLPDVDSRPELLADQPIPIQLKPKMAQPLSRVLPLR